MFKLSLGDLWRGLVMAVFGAGSVAVLGTVGAVVLDPAFDLFTTDFAALLKSLANSMVVASWSAGSSYLLKNLLTDDRQNFLGIKTRS